MKINPLKAIKKLLSPRNLLITAVSAASTPFVYYTSVSTASYMLPPKPVTTLEETCFIPVKWYGIFTSSSQLEISNIKDEICREQFEKPFYTKLFLQPIPDSPFLRWIFPKEIFAGTYSQRLNRIRIFSMHPWTVVHEIKHAKHADVASKHPEFNVRWDSLARDSNGKSLYFENKQQYKVLADSMFFGVNKAKHLDDALKLGFCTGYARYNMEEDIAELCSFAEINTAIMGSYLANPDQYPLVASKIRLASEYGLLPPEYESFALISNLYFDLESSNDNKNRGLLMHKIFTRSEEFLTNHTNSVYASEVHYHLAKAFVIAADNPELPEQYKSKFYNFAIDQYKKVLASRWKKGVDYYFSLFGISRCYRGLGDDDKALQYLSAVGEYNQRNNQGDASLLKQGIDDYLMENGLLD